VLATATAPAGAQPASSPTSLATSRSVGMEVAPAQIPIPNPASWFFRQVFVNPFKGSAKKTISTALKAAEVAFVTPDVTTQPRVRELWQGLLIVADSLLLLLFVVGAVMIVAGDWTYVEAKELAPRALLAGVVVNLSLVVLSQGIDISNLLVKGFLQVDPNSLSVTTDRLMQSGVAAPLVLALLLIGALLLLIANLVRIVILVILGIAGPVLHVFGVLPQTDSIARGWWRAATACLVAPAVQALLLTIGVKVFFSGQGSLAVTGSSGAKTLVDMVMVIVIIMMMAWVPLWMFKRAIGVTRSHVVRSARFLAAATGVA